MNQILSTLLSQVHSTMYVRFGQEGCFVPVVGRETEGETVCTEPCCWLVQGCVYYIRLSVFCCLIYCNSKLMSVHACRVETHPLRRLRTARSTRSSDTIQGFHHALKLYHSKSFTTSNNSQRS